MHKRASKPTGLGNNAVVMVTLVVSFSSIVAEVHNSSSIAVQWLSLLGNRRLRAGNAEKSQISYVDDRGDFIFDDGCAINLRRSNDWKLECWLSDD